MNKILIKLYIPKIGQQYDCWIPVSQNIYNIIQLLVKAVNEMNDGVYKPNKLPLLYNKVTGKPYNINLNIKKTDIRNGTELILI